LKGYEQVLAAILIYTGAGVNDIHLQIELVVGVGLAVDGLDFINSQDDEEVSSLLIIFNGVLNYVENGQLEVLPIGLQGPAQEVGPPDYLHIQLLLADQRREGEDDLLD